MGATDVPVRGFASAWGHLVQDLAADPRVPRHAKVMAAAMVGTGPATRLLRSRGPSIGAIGELALVAVALRQLISTAGYDIVREQWQGDDASFVWLLVLTGLHH